MPSTDASAARWGQAQNLSRQLLREVLPSDEQQDFPLARGEGRKGGERLFGPVGGVDPSLHSAEVVAVLERTSPSAGDGRRSVLLCGDGRSTDGGRCRSARGAPHLVAGRSPKPSRARRGRWPPPGRRHLRADGNGGRRKPRRRRRVGNTASQDACGSVARRTMSSESPGSRPATQLPARSLPWRDSTVTSLLARNPRRRNAALPAIGRTGAALGRHRLGDQGDAFVTGGPATGGVSLPEPPSCRLVANARTPRAFLFTARNTRNDHDDHRGNPLPPAPAT